MASKWSKPGDELTHSTHPESHAEHTYQPNPTTIGPTHVDALDMPGATSKDLHTGMGKPMQGMEGREVNHQLRGRKHEEGRMHPRGRVKEGTGLVGVGAEPPKDPIRGRGLDLPEGIERGMKGKHKPEWPGAEERVPESAEHVAAEQP
ncbi:hypothetical protein B0T18DRAFT_429709 [Schizothecium vesticola]|uniref:Uncharacterized protein n=1 Tax=Schizothecium vesticola TaxID=314040 RepID=A0AA40EWX6_9PEZI|nr:hypothetical protein B0T18DRAFT_429709 [Schizothecium vesticola]